MKNFALVILLTAAGILSSCQNQKKVTEVLYNEYNNKDGFSVLILPPSFVDKFVSQEKEDQRELLKSVSDFRIMFFNQDIDKDGGVDAVYAEVNKLLDKRSFEDYLAIQKDGSDILVKGVEKNDLLREMHVIIRAEDKLIMASFTGKIDKNKAFKTIQDFDSKDFDDLENFSGDFDFEDFKWTF